MTPKAKLWPNSRAKSKPPEEPLLGANKKGAVFVLLAAAVLAALAWLSGHHL